MQNFIYFTPTKVVFGKDAEKQTGTLLKEQNAKKVLVHYGGGSAKRSGLLDIVEKSIRDAGIDFIELGGVVPNPHLSKVYEGIELCRKEHVDFLLAVGGGSVIDSCKAIGYGMANEGDVWDFYTHARNPSACMPVGVVLTLSATGSEMSNSSVITNEKGGIKRGCNTDLCRPKFALMNPELTYTVPMYQTQSGCADILMHTMERYFNSEKNNMELTDSLAEAEMRTVIHNAKILLKDPHNYAARAEVMWAGSLSHNGLMGCGTDGGDWASHQIEHEMGGMFDVTHGAGLAAIWSSWARYVYQNASDRFAKFAVNVLNVDPGKNDEETALKGISAMENFYHEIGMPTSMHELGINPTEAQILEMADKCSWHGKRTVGTVKKLNSDDIAAIYRMALNK